MTLADAMQSGITPARVSYGEAFAGPQSAGDGGSATEWRRVALAKSGLDTRCALLWAS